MLLLLITIKVFVKNFQLYYLVSYSINKILAAGQHLKLNCIRLSFIHIIYND